MPCRSPGIVFQHALQVVSQHDMHRGISRPTPRGEVEGSGQEGVSRNHKANDIGQNVEM